MAWAFAAVLLILQGLWLPAAAQANFASLPQDEKMARRHPQPVRVGDLIGLPVLDDQDSTIGYIRDVVRTPAGRIQLIVPYGKWFGWVGSALDGERRPVAVPIETVAILGRQVDALEFPREAFDAAPTVVPGAASSIDRNATIQIALGRR